MSRDWETGQDEEDPNIFYYEGNDGNIWSADLTLSEDSDTIVRPDSDEWFDAVAWIYGNPS